MGLDIRGKGTGHHIGGSYSRLHQTARYLALVWCGMPDLLGKDNKDEDISCFSAYMYYPTYKFIKAEYMEKFLTAIQLSGYYFPNLLMHSDCEGNYTKRGKNAPETERWEKGNSLKLLKELNRICEDDDIINHESERVKNALPYTIKFRDLVKDEIENGTGTILFR